MLMMKSKGVLYMDGMYEQEQHIVLHQIFSQHIQVGTYFSPQHEKYVNL